MVGPRHTFADLAEAVDLAFARWDRSHLHVFELADGRRIGFADVDPEEHGWLDHHALKVARELSAGERFNYTFDLGDDWRHRCQVLEEKVDPHLLFEPGELPALPVAIWGGAGSPTSTGARASRSSRSRPAQHALADHRAAQEHEREVQFGVTLIAGAQSAKVVQPRKGALDDPPLCAEARAMLDAAPGDRWRDAARSERPTVPVVVIAAVGEQPLGTPAGTSGLAGDRADPIEQR
jgi:Plasmid pRiA4b ORF-3-like protein